MRTEGDQLSQPITIAEGYHDFEGRWIDVPQATIDAIRQVMAQEDAPGPFVVRRGETLAFDAPVDIELEDGTVLDGVLSVPQDAPLGYHRVTADGSSRDLILGPERCYLPDGYRVWGWAVQLYSLWSKRSWGIGDLGDLATFGRWAADNGAEVVLLNPLHAAPPTTPYENSPYYPSSRCFLDPLYVDVESVPGAEVLDASTREVARSLTASSQVERDAVRDAKLGALEKIWRTTGAHRDAQDFLSERGDALEGFATYCVIAESHGADWRAWPEMLRHPSGRAVADVRRSETDRFLFHVWIQMLLDEQFARAAESIGIINDLAIGVAPSGADAWLWQDSFATGVSIGAPPDDYNLDGQDWGILGSDPSGLRADGYRAFIEMVRSSMRHSAGIRFDHVMGLFRLFWIPGGMSAREGSYVRYPSDDLITILALESHRARSFVIGEDLGTVEDGVREEMAERNMLSYRLLWFLDQPIDELPALSMASANTHDLPTTIGLWEGSDLRRQEQLGLIPATGFADKMIERICHHLRLNRDASVREVVEASCKALAASNSAVVIVAIDDAVGTAHRYNYPGTTGDLNWTTRLPVPLEELTHHEGAERIARIMRSGR